MAPACRGFLSTHCSCASIGLACSSVSHCVVYHMTQVKILGILLFAVEILWFVARPIIDELVVWWKLREQIHQRRRYRLSMAVAAVALLTITVPWPHRVEVPAVMEPVSVQRIAAPVAGQLKQINVKAGARRQTGRYPVHNGIAEDRTRYPGNENQSRSGVTAPGPPVSPTSWTAMPPWSSISKYPAFTSRWPDSTVFRTS